MNGSLQIFPIQTRVFGLGSSLAEFVTESLGFRGLRENDILAITSKIISLAENRIVWKADVTKDELVKKEADIYLGEVLHGCHLTVKHGLFIPSAGIDESNAAGEYYILYPKDPFQSAFRIWQQLKEKYRIKNLGIILTDSHTSPLRKGVTGVALSHWGIRGVRNLIGKPDIFGSILKMTQVSVVDALAAGAVLVMGEADEKVPLALLQYENVDFTETTDVGECRMPILEDLYSPIFRHLIPDDPQKV